MPKLIPKWVNLFFYCLKLKKIIHKMKFFEKSIAWTMIV